MTIRSNENREYTNVGNHPKSWQFSTSTTVRDLVKHHLPLGSTRVLRVFYDQDKVNYLFGLDRDNAILCAVNDSRRWEISLLRAIDRAA